VGPSVSVVIAAFNAADFLARAVRSAQTQTLPPSEIIIVDDASTDGTVETVRQLMADDGRIRLIELPSNGGPSAARNAGFAAARGDWIAVLDADDAFLPQRLQTVLHYAGGADVVVDNFCYYNAMTRRTGAPVLGAGQGAFQVSFAEFLSHARPFTGEADWGLLKPVFRRSFLDQHALRYALNSRHGEDFLLLAQAFLSGARYVRVLEAGYLYTGRSSNLSRSRLDYHTMYRHSQELSRDPRLRAQPVLIARLRERVAAVRKLAAVTDLERLQKERGYGRMMRHMLSDPAFSVLVAKKLVRRVLQPLSRRSMTGSPG
jgi:succinoglycan biosynthesis protein ExoO